MNSTRRNFSKHKPTEEKLEKAANSKANNENLHNMSRLSNNQTNRNSISSRKRSNSTSSTNSSRSWLSRASEYASSVLSPKPKSEANKEYNLFRANFSEFNKLNQYQKIEIFSRGAISNNNRIKKNLMNKLQIQNSLRNLSNVDLTNILLRLIEKKTAKNIEIMKKIFEICKFNKGELDTIHYKCTNLNCTDYTQTTLLIIAIENENLEAVKLLVENGADVNLKITNVKLIHDNIFFYMSPFNAALITGNEEIIKYLINKINIENEKKIIKTLQLDYKNTLLRNANNYYKKYKESIAQPVKKQLLQNELSNLSFKISENSKRHKNVTV